MYFMYTAAVENRTIKPLTLSFSYRSADVGMSGQQYCKNICFNQVLKVFSQI